VVEFSLVWSNKTYNSRRLTKQQTILIKMIHLFIECFWYTRVEIDRLFFIYLQTTESYGKRNYYIEFSSEMHLWFSAFLFGASPAPSPSEFNLFEHWCIITSTLSTNKLFAAGDRHIIAFLFTNNTVNQLVYKVLRPFTNFFCNPILQKLLHRWQSFLWL
jgi:hypothetical protein